MKNQSAIPNPKSRILIVGAGPAGASLAIRLAQRGFDVVLVEREKFPRHKLCGEFVSPECLEHFRALGVLDEMLETGGDRILETVFYAPSGKNVRVPSEWFGGAGGALGISRAEMDRKLLEKCGSLGVKIFEETSVTGLSLENEAVRGIKAKSKDGQTHEIAADLTIDATGRAGVLAKLWEKERRRAKNRILKTKNRRPQLIGFKAHLENVRMERGRCEIYLFRGGYGGLSYVENNRANHCFLIEAETVKKYIGQTNKMIEEVIYENRRARETMERATPAFDWLTVSVDGFGRKNLNPAPNLFTVGDAAAFIDPFTGSGMLMGLESAEILADCIVRNPLSAAEIAREYALSHRRCFDRRLRVCRVLRRAAFVPHLAGALISALSLSSAAREILARATRRNVRAEKIKP